MLCNTDNDPAKEKAYIDELRSYRPAGLLIIPASERGLSSEAGAAGIPQGIPLIFLDRRPSDWKGDAVMVANEEGAFQATQYLLKMGHTRLAMLSGPSHVTNAVERLAGFRRALAKHRVVITPEYVQETRFDRDSGYRSALRLLNMLPRPTAIFAANDMVALGALLAVRELGLRCPKDVSIIGFDDLDLGMFTDPALSSVHQSGRKWVRRRRGFSLNVSAAKKGARSRSSCPRNCASAIPWCSLTTIIRRNNFCGCPK